MQIFGHKIYDLFAVSIFMSPGMCKIQWMQNSKIQWMAIHWILNECDFFWMNGIEKMNGKIQNSFSKWMQIQNSKNSFFKNSKLKKFFFENSKKFKIHFHSLNGNSMNGNEWEFKKNECLFWRKKILKNYFLFKKCTKSFKNRIILHLKRVFDK